MLDLLRRLLITLNDTELEVAAQLVAEAQADRELLRAFDGLAGDHVVEQHRRGRVFYQLELVNCGCTACSCTWIDEDTGKPMRSYIHGPYWYRYEYRRKGEAYTVSIKGQTETRTATKHGFTKRYEGKKRPAALAEGSKGSVERVVDDRFRHLEQICREAISRGEWAIARQLADRLGDPEHWHRVIDLYAPIEPAMPVEEPALASLVVEVEQVEVLEAQQDAENILGNSEGKIIEPLMSDDDQAQLAQLLAALREEREPVREVYGRLGWSRQEFEALIGRHWDALPTMGLRLHVATKDAASGRKERYITVSGTRYAAISLDPQLAPAQASMPQLDQAADLRQQLRDVAGEVEAQAQVVSTRGLLWLSVSEQAVGLYQQSVARRAALEELHRQHWQGQRPTESQLAAALGRVLDMVPHDPVLHSLQDGIAVLREVAGEEHTLRGAHYKLLRDLVGGVAQAVRQAEARECDAFQTVVALQLDEDHRRDVVLPALEAVGQGGLAARLVQ